MIRKQKSAIAIVAAVILAGSWLLIFSRNAGPTATQVYYLDTATGELFAHDDVPFPPVSTDAVREGVRAQVFACGDCADSAARFVAYTEKYSDAYRQAAASDDPIPPDIDYQGQMLGSADGKQWMPKGSPEAQNVIMSLADRCGGKAVQTCLPR